MHRLVPKFILDQLAEDQLSGNFHAISLSVDISGFTPLATALMEYSTEGAEVIAEVLGALFEPLIEIIYAHGGFVATFAGDAFTALFPADPTRTEPAAESADAQVTYHHAVVAAWQCSEFVQKNANQTTRFGKFTFAVRISIADGTVDWKIWQCAKTGETAHWSQRAAYSFTGEAFERCFEADAFVPAGEIILTKAIYAQLPPAAVTVTPLAHHYCLTQLTSCFIDQIAAKHMLPPLLEAPLTGQFFPPSLWQHTTSGEFRQVVSMFINLAQLPEGQAGVTFEHRLFQQIAQYGGYLCSIGRTGRHDQACTIILFWGAPASHEDNVARALRFILEMRQIAPVPIRVGITHHLAYAGFIGAVQRTEYTCYGVHVALATRQMAGAQWGEIVLDEATAAHAHNEFHLIPQGQRQYKGFMEPRSIYLLAERRERRAAARDRVPLIGREREILELNTLVKPLFAGKFGGIVLITGDAGIGKSRLLREFERLVTAPGPHEQKSAAPVPAQGVVDQGEKRETEPAVDAPHGTPLPPLPVWHYCQTDEILRQPLHPFRYLLRRYFNQLHAQDLELNRQQFVERFDELLAATADPDLASELARLRPVLAALLELPWEESYQQLDPELRLENSFSALKTLLSAESRRRPIIIQLEDAHWLDTESRLFLERLLRTIEDSPLLLLLTARETETIPTSTNAVQPPKILAGIPHTVLRLQPLSKYNLRLLATAWLESPITQETLDLLQERAKGNPFFAEQMLRYWQEQDLLHWGDQGWQFAETPEAPYAESPSPLSPNIRTLLTARLDNLPASVRTVIQTAAVVGSEFDYRVLTHMLEPTVLAPDDSSLIEQRGIWDAVSPVSYRFHHALLCDVAYGMQSRTQIQRLHHRAAAAIQAVHRNDLRPHYGALVYHYYKAGDQEQERHYAKLAGLYAAENFLNEEALRYFDRAVALTPPDEPAACYELYVARSAVYQWLGNQQEQRQDIHRQFKVAQAAGNQRWTAEALLRAADYERITGDYEAAINHCQQVVALAIPMGDSVLQGRGRYIWGRVLRHQGRYPEAHEQLQRALAAAHKTDERSLEANCLYEIGHLSYVQNSYQQAAVYYSRAEAIYQLLDDKKGQINCLLVFGGIYYGRGIFAEAERLYQKALTITRTLGWQPGETTCLSSLGNTYFDIGDYATAHYYHIQALRLWQELGDREGEAVSLDTLGLIAHSQGALDTAQEYYANALAIQQELGDQHGAAYTQTHLGHTLLAKDQPTEACDCFHTALCIRQTLGEVGPALDSLAGLACVQWRTGDLTAAAATVSRILQQLDSKGIDGLEFPTQVYLICYEVLQAVGEDQPGHQECAQERAESVLEKGYQLVRERAARIADPQLRQLFLTEVRSNAKLLARRAQRNISNR